MSSLYFEETFITDDTGVVLTFLEEGKDMLSLSLPAIHVVDLKQEGLGIVFDGHYWSVRSMRFHSSGAMVRLHTVVCEEGPWSKKVLLKELLRE